MKKIYVVLSIFVLLGAEISAVLQERYSLAVFLRAKYSYKEAPIGVQHVPHSSKKMHKKREATAPHVEIQKSVHVNDDKLSQQAVIEEQSVISETTNLHELPANNCEFAIIIPSYNNERYYKENLDSVCWQNSTNPYHIYYINDCSTDATGKLVEEYIKKNGLEEKVTLINNSVNIGGCANVYNAIHGHIADHKIVVMLDGDDLLPHNDVLLTLENYYQDNELWMTYGSALAYPSKEELWYMSSELPGEVLEKKKLREHAFITQHVKTFKAGLFKKIQKEDLYYKDEFMRVSWDIALMFPMLEMSAPKDKGGKNHSAFVKEILYLYRTDNPLNDFRLRGDLQLKVDYYIRSLKPYKPIDSLDSEVVSINTQDSSDQNEIKEDVALEKKNADQLINHGMNPRAINKKKKKKKPKIAFLFLTKNDVYHETAWTNFFKNHEHQYSLYVHPKESVSKDSFFAHAVIDQREVTTWENTMRAEIALLREALKDQANTKFVFISESTIPLVSFDEVYDHMLAHPHSEFKYEKNPHPWRVFGNLSNTYKNPQWIVLNRKHAQLMVDDSYFINIFAQASFDNEHYPSTFLAHQNLLDEVVNKPTTLAIWKEHLANPHLFKDLKNDPYTKYLRRGIKKKYLFARKFAPTCDLSFFHKYIPELY